MEGILTTQPFTLLLRTLTAVAACVMFYFSIRALRKRRAVEISDYADWVLAGVSGYWAAYTLYILFVYDGHAVPPIDLYIFNMRFGLLLTLSALIPLIKDRILITDLYDAVRKKEIAEDEPDDI